MNTRNNSVYKKTSGYSGYLATGSGQLSEIQLQSKCFQWAWNTYPDTRRLLAHVPNGGARNAREGVTLKASGVVAGVWDMFFYWKEKLYWFELKVGSNKQSEEQTLFAEAMVSHGAECYEIRSFEQFQTIFLKIIHTF